MTRNTLSFLPAAALVLSIGVFFAPPAAAAEDQALNELLKRTGRLVELFWEQVPSFACLETVAQQKLGRKGKVEYQQESVFDYVAFTKTEGRELTVEELRLPHKKSAVKPNAPALLRTNGFQSLLLIFHPSYQSNYTYRMEMGEGENKALRVNFEHIPGTPSSSAVMIRDRIYPFELQGTAWIDPLSGSIQKISAHLMAPMKDINVENFGAEVSYVPQVFPMIVDPRISGSAAPSWPDAGTAWLPSIARIEIQTALQHWRNTHAYSQYKRFSVQSTESFSK